MKYVLHEDLEHFLKWLNIRLNDVARRKTHSCINCGAPYKGRAKCEYCGRGFFVDFTLFKEKMNE